jgi:hypothetical protein
MFCGRSTETSARVMPAVLPKVNAAANRSGSNVRKRITPTVVTVRIIVGTVVSACALPVFHSLYQILCADAWIMSIGGRDDLGMREWLIVGSCFERPGTARRRGYAVKELDQGIVSPLVATWLTV